MKINYDDGHKQIEIEVSDKFGNTYLEIETESKRLQWREDYRQRKHLCSIECFNDHCEEIASTEISVENMFIENEEKDKLHKAIANLLPEQQELLRKIYFEGEKITDIAKAQGVDKSAITHRLETVYKKLKKYLK